MKSLCVGSIGLMLAVIAVAQTPTTIVVSSSVAIPKTGQPVVLTATVSPAATGTVEFLDDFRILGTAVLNGGSQASLPIRFPIPRTYNIRAVYAGTGSHARSISPVLNLSVRNVAPTTFTGSLLLPPSFGTPIWHDINRDGVLDYVAASESEFVTSVYLGNGSGAFTKAGDYPNLVFTALADFDNDGFVDALARNAQSSDTLLKGNGTGSFTAVSTLPFGSWSTLDYNRDGRADYIRRSFPTVNSSADSIILGQGNGMFDSTPAATQNGSGFVADLNLDQLADRAHGYTFRVGTGPQTVTVKETVLSWTTVKSTLGLSPSFVEDLNGDGRDDIVSFTMNGPVSVMLTSADGSSSAPVTVVPKVADLNAVLDWNGDGVADLIALESAADNNSSPYHLVVYPGLGNGTFGAKMYGMYYSPAAFEVRDVNDDGYVDLMTFGEAPVVLLGTASGVGMALEQPSIQQYNAGREYEFVASFQSAAGAATLQKAYVRISPLWSDANACLVEVTPMNGSATVRLADDSGAVFTTNLQNSQCSVRSAGIQVTSVGNTLSVRLPVTFRRGFVAPLTVSLRSVSAGGDSGYSPVRTIAPPSTTPLHVTPDSGTGASATFQAKFAASLPAQLTLAYLLIGDQPGTGWCQVEYNASTNRFRLLDAGGWVSPAPGATSVSSSTCTLNTAAASASTSNVANLRFTDVNIPLDFKPALNGARKLFMLSFGSDGTNSGWQEVGAFTVANNTTSPGGTPATGTLTPAGPNRYTGTFSHTGGAQQLYLGYMLFLPTPNVVQFTAQGSCLVEYNAISNGMRLINDAGTGWLPGELGRTVGLAGDVLSNSICTVDPASSTAVQNGSTLTVTAHVTFNAPNATPRLTTFLQAADVKDHWTGMTQQGVTLVPNAGATRPGPQITSTAIGPTVGSVTITPDPNRVLTMVHLRIADRIIGSPVCHAVYFVGEHAVNLINDSENAMVSPTNVPAGTATTLSNSRCTLDVSQTGSTGTSTTQQTFTFKVLSKPGFAGQRTYWFNAFDSDNRLTHWVDGGSAQF